MNSLAFDTETRGLRWELPDERACLVSWATAIGSFAVDLDNDPQGTGHFLDHVRGLREGDRIWGHHLKFDLHHIREATGFDVLDWAEAHGVELWDTDWLDRVLNPEGQNEGALATHGLKELDARYLAGKAARYEEQLRERAAELGISLKSTPQAYYLIYQQFPDEMKLYAAQDARSTYDVGEYHLLPQLAAADEGLKRVAKLEREVLPVLYLAERRGVATDQEQVLKFRRQFQFERYALLDKLHRELGDDVVLEGEGSHDSLREALLKAGVPLVERTQNGELSTSRAALSPLVDDYPVVADLFEYRRVVRFLNTYIEPMVGREVIHTEFFQNEAWTGRMASRRPNMQNWPQRAGKEVRNVLRARPGHRLVVADYSQMEAMIIIRYLNDPRMVEAINNGLDLNAWMAAQIWGGEPADWDKNGPRAEGEKSRKTARHTLYATMYGAGGRRVTQQLPFLDRGPWYDEDAPAIINARARGRDWPKPGWQYAEARNLISKVKGSLPGWWAFNKRLGMKIDRVGHVNTYYGRKNPVSREKKYVAVAAIVQGTGADILKLAAVRARPALAPYGAEIVMFTHDELVAEVPEAQAEGALAALVAAMEGAAPDHNPHLRASGHIVTHYGED